MIFELAQDFHDAAAAMPSEHAGRHVLELLEQAIRRDIHFIDRHPTTLLQCLWNSCRWYDPPEAAQHYDEPEGSWRPDELPWPQPTEVLSAQLEGWRLAKESAGLESCWVRSLRPPPSPLCTREMNVLRGHKGVVKGVDVSPDGRRLLTCHGHPDDAVRIWDLDSGQALSAFRVHAGDLSCARFSSGGQMVAVTSIYDPLVAVCDASSGVLLLGLHGCDAVEGKVAGVSCLAFSPDGQRIAVGANDHMVRVWELPSGELCLHLQGHEDSIQNVAFSPDGRWVASASCDKTVRIWDAHSGVEVHCLRGHGAWVTGLAFSPDSQTVASGSHDQTIRLWDLRTGGEVARFTGHADPVVSLAFSPDGQRLASGAFENEVRVWEVAGGRLLDVIEGHQHSITEVRYHPDGRRLISSSWDETVRIWDMARTPQGLHLSGSRQELLSVSMSIVSRRVATGSQEGLLDLWDAESGVLLRTIPAHEHSIANVAFSPDGKRVVSGSRDTAIRVWDVDTGQMTLDLGKHKLWPVWLTFSSDGRSIVCLFYDGEARTWDADTGDCVRTGSGSTAFLQEARLPRYIREWRGAWDVETLFEDGETGKPLAWFPEPLYLFAWSASARRWAGCCFRGGHLFMLALEGWIATPGGEVHGALREPRIRAVSYPEETRDQRSASSTNVG